MFKNLSPHLKDLQKRLIIIAACLIISFILCFSFWREIFGILKAPLDAVFRSDVKGILIQTAPAEGIIVALKVSFFSAVFICVPIMFWQIWEFVSPGLYKHEKRLVLPFVFFGSIMFAIGVSFAYFFALPYALKYILAFGNSEFSANITASNYVTFLTRFILGFGISFELPVLSYFLGKVGLITHKTLQKYFKYAIVAIFVIAAIITPPDVLSQIFMALPLILLYLLSMLILKISVNAK
ncbi:MAG: twin-arginine translocase subunit TatC [Helicobacter sp.]|nr:twin-arginine translocase subunit TatC [Helicobacter sp.]